MQKLIIVFSEIWEEERKVKFEDIVAKPFPEWINDMNCQIQKVWRMLNTGNKYKWNLNKGRSLKQAEIKHLMGNGRHIRLLNKKISWQWNIISTCWEKRPDISGFYSQPNFSSVVGTSGLRIQHYNCSGLGPCCGVGLVPGLGTSTCCGPGIKQKKRVRMK